MKRGILHAVPDPGTVALCGAVTARAMSRPVSTYGGAGPKCLVLVVQRHNDTAADNRRMAERLDRIAMLAVPPDEVVHASRA